MFTLCIPFNSQPQASYMCRNSLGSDDNGDDEGEITGEKEGIQLVVTGVDGR